MKKQNDQSLERIDTNHAWEAFKRKVSNESVPEFWTRAEPDSANTKLAPDRVGSMQSDSDPDSAEQTGLHASQQHHLRTAHSAEETSLNRRRRNKMLRKWIAGVAAATIVGTILFTPVGSNALASLLNTFRLQHLDTVPITMGDLERLNQSLTEGSVDMTNFDLSQYGQVSQQGGGSIRTVTVAEATQLAGYPLKMLPGQSAGTTLVEIQPQLKLIFELHTTPINKLLSQLGGKSKLPASVDSRPIAIDIPTMIRVSSGNVKEGSGSGKSLFQLQAPSLTVPDGVDVDQVRKAILELPLLPEDLRSKLEGIQDWRHTLPLPSLEGNGSSVQTSVSGREAVLSLTRNSRTLVWLDNGHVFRLSGSTIDYPDDNAILADAKEIIKQ